MAWPWGGGQVLRRGFAGRPEGSAGFGFCHLSPENNPVVRVFPDLLLSRSLPRPFLTVRKEERSCMMRVLVTVRCDALCR